MSMTSSGVAYIHSFKIDGLAGHGRPVERHLDRYVNVFWGLNGTGKTSLLKILHAAMRNETSELSKVPFTNAEVTFWSDEAQTFVRRSFAQDDNEYEVITDEDGDQWRRSKGDSWELVAHSPTWHSELLVEGPDSLLQDETELTPKTAKVLERPYLHSYLPISRLSEVHAPRFRTQSRPVVVDDTFLDEQFADHVHARWQSYNSSALASIRAIQQKGLAAILAILFGGAAEEVQRADLTGASAAVNEVTGQDAYSLVTGFLMEQGIALSVSRKEFIRRYEEESALQEVVSSIEATTGRVGDALKPQQEFSNVLERLYSGGKILVLDAARLHTRSGIRIAIGEKTVRIQSLSSGEKQLLRLMLEVLAAEGSTVMIDEPELSMHVDWQLLLVESMRKINPGCQLLLATHSPEVMANVEADLVFQL